VDSTLEKPMPLGIGEIFDKHEEIKEDEFMHPAFIKHINPLDNEILKKIRIRRVFKVEE
jgi:hypothetical protein